MMNRILSFKQVFVLALALAALPIITFSQNYQSRVIQLKLTDVAVTSLDASQLGSIEAISSLPTLHTLAQQHGATSIERVFRFAGKDEAKHIAFGLHRWVRVKFNNDIDVEAVAAEFGLDVTVSISEAVPTKQLITNEVTPVDVNLLSVANDPLYINQWHYNNNGNNPNFDGVGQGGLADADIDLPEAHDLETGSNQVIVQVIDTGVRLDHSDLAGALWVNAGEIAGDGIDNDNNGFIDDVNGYSHADGDADVADTDGHGSHTAGTIGAITNNGVGVAGVAGGSGTADGVRLMISQGFGQATGGFAEALVYGADNGAVISSNSWGNSFPNSIDQAVNDATDYFRANAGGPGEAMDGGLVVFAAGNSGNIFGTAKMYPAAYGPNIAVAATERDDKYASYTGKGGWVDISGPGSAVVSTYGSGPNAYAAISGTSMATPHVAGVLALAVSHSPGQTDGFMRTALENPANLDNIDAQNPGQNSNHFGAGRLNAFKLLSALPGVGLPVELSEFGFVRSANGVSLNWTTQSEVNVARFDVEQLVGEKFSAIGSVESAGAADRVTNYSFNTSLVAGTFQFRIKAIDVDGSTTISEVLTVTVDVPGAFELSAAYPNPFNPTTQFNLAVAETQNVRVEMFNVLGQRVAVLHNGQLLAGETHQFTFDAAELPSGLYFYRATGATFSATRQVSLLK